MDLNNFFYLCLRNTFGTLLVSACVPMESIHPENLSPFTSVQWTLSATETND